MKYIIVTTTRRTRCTPSMRLCWPEQSYPAGYRNAFWYANMTNAAAPGHLLRGPL